MGACVTQCDPSEHGPPRRWPSHGPSRGGRAKTPSRSASCTHRQHPTRETDPSHRTRGDETLRSRGVAVIVSPSPVSPYLRRGAFASARCPGVVQRPSDRTGRRDALPVAGLLGGNVASPGLERRRVRGGQAGMHWRVEVVGEVQAFEEARGGLRLDDGTGGRGGRQHLVLQTDQLGPHGASFVGSCCSIHPKGPVLCRIPRGDPVAASRGVGMGLSYRRSFSAGPFRVNPSQ